MQCPVCHGSGLSAANALFDRAIPCGGCNGSGWLADDLTDDESTVDEPTDDEPTEGVGGVLGASAAFQRHYLGIFGADTGQDRGATGDISGAATTFEQLQHLLDLDQRHLREMANTLPGRASDQTKERLEDVVAGYRRLTEIATGGLPGLEHHDLQRKLANALRSLGQVRESLHDPDGAEEAYEEARSAYAGLGAAHELASMDASLRQLRLHRDRDVDTTLDELRARLSDTPAGLDRAQLLIELGEIHASRHDDLEAEDLFRAAERELGPHRDQATGIGIADALMASLPTLLTGQTPSLMGSFESITRVTTLLQRVYAGLTQVLVDADPVEAQRYVELRRQLQGSTADGSQLNLDFSRRMLEGLFGDGGIDPAGDDRDVP